MIVNRSLKIEYFLLLFGINKNNSAGMENTQWLM